MELVLDIEATGLLDETTIDYKSVPYKLKDSFKIHCVHLKDRLTGQKWAFVGDEIKIKLVPLMRQATKLILQNGINYDLLAIKLYLGADYTIGPDTFDGLPIEIEDTLVLSKTLNPDRAAHSLEWWGEQLGFSKMDWRQEAINLGLIKESSPRGAEFAVYHPRMSDYCEIDVEITDRLYDRLKLEWGTWDWNDAYQLEKKVAFIITQQSHRGFYFHHEKAKEFVVYLDKKMEEIRQKVEPIIPPKPITKTAAKEYVPPKKQFKQDGTLSALMEKWCDKHNLKPLQSVDGWSISLNGREVSLPLVCEPILTTVAATLDDTTHLKEVLVGWGWEPSAFKEKDLTLDSNKHKKTKEQYEKSATRYAEETLASNFCSYRCEQLRCTPETLLTKLLSHDLKKPLKVLTNPTITVGQDKEIDPELLKLSEKFAYARDVSDYLTYRHRRNSIVGGGVDPDAEEATINTGFLSVDRIYEDHRIPTPADTCGAGTSRFLHKLVANIPRVTSLYGEQMRSLFGVDKGCYQIGYDFDSLEAKIEAHYVHRYPGGPEYGVSLTAAKPNSVHCVTARKIGEMLGQDFSRANAKSLKYGCSYGAQAGKVAKIVGCSIQKGQIIYEAFWEAASPLKNLKENLEKYWENVGQQKFILGIDGRKVPTRSKHALMNSLFQSGGVICAKRAMAIHYDKLKAKGLIVDFFKDNWMKQPYVQQLIAYHDESQLEASKSLVRFKTFTTEEEAKAFSMEGKLLSDVGHAPDGRYYRAYSVAGVLACEAVKEAGEYYNLKVDLTAGYMVGVDWASCH